MHIVLDQYPYQAICSTEGHPHLTSTECEDFLEWLKIPSNKVSLGYSETTSHMSTMSTYGSANAYQAPGCNLRYYTWGRLQVEYVQDVSSTELATDYLPGAQLYNVCRDKMCTPPGLPPPPAPPPDTPPPSPPPPCARIRMMSGTFSGQTGPDLPAMLCSMPGLHRSDADTDYRCDPRIRGAYTVGGELGPFGRANQFLAEEDPLRSQTTTCTDGNGVQRDAILWSTYPERAVAGSYPASVPSYTDLQSGESIAGQPEVPESGDWDTFSRAAYIHGWAVDNNEIDTHDADAMTSSSIDYIWARKRNFNAIIDTFEIEMPNGWDRLGTAGTPGSPYAYSGAPLTYTRHAYASTSEEAPGYPGSDASYVGITTASQAAQHFEHALNAYATTEQTGKCIKITPRFKSGNVPIVMVDALANPENPSYVDTSIPGFEAPVTEMPICADQTEEDFAFYVVVAPRETGELQCGLVGNQPLPNHGIAPYTTSADRYRFENVEYYYASSKLSYPPLDLPNYFAATMGGTNVRGQTRKPAIAIPATATTLALTGIGYCDSDSGHCVDAPTLTHPLPREMDTSPSNYSDTSGTTDLMFYCHTAKAGTFTSAPGSWFWSPGTDVQGRVVDAFDVRIIMGAADNTYDQTSPTELRLRGPTLGNYPGTTGSARWLPQSVLHYGNENLTTTLKGTYGSVAEFNRQYGCGILNPDDDGMRPSRTTEYTTADGGTDDLGDWSGFFCLGGQHNDSGQCERTNLDDPSYVALRLRGGVFESTGTMDRCATAPLRIGSQPRLAESLHNVRISMDTRMLTWPTNWPYPPYYLHSVCGDTVPMSQPCCGSEGQPFHTRGRHALVGPTRPLHPGEEFEITYWRTWMATLCCEHPYPNSWGRQYPHGCWGWEPGSQTYERIQWYDHVEPVFNWAEYPVKFGGESEPPRPFQADDNCVMFPDYPEWSAFWQQKIMYVSNSQDFPTKIERSAYCNDTSVSMQDKIRDRCFTYNDIGWFPYDGHFSELDINDWPEPQPGDWANQDKMFRWFTCKYRVRDDALTYTGVEHSELTVPVMKWNNLAEINSGSFQYFDNFVPECYDAERDDVPSPENRNLADLYPKSGREPSSYTGCKVKIVAPVKEDTETCFYSTIETDYVRTVANAGGGDVDTKAHTVSQRSVNCIKATSNNQQTSRRLERENRVFTPVNTSYTQLEDNAQSTRRRLQAYSKSEVIKTWVNVTLAARSGIRPPMSQEEFDALVEPMLVAQYEEYKEYLATLSPPPPPAPPPPRPPP
ncbi:MAG: hypothetical protein ACPIOQ_01380, partial [Promethearchaeia archaeon]